MCFNVRVPWTVGEWLNDRWGSLRFEDNSGKADITSIDKIPLEEIDGLVQDCCISISNALEILQSCTKPSNGQTIKWVVHCVCCNTWPNTINIRRGQHADRCAQAGGLWVCDIGFWNDINSLSIWYGCWGMSQTCWLIPGSGWDISLVDMGLISISFESWIC